MSNLRANSSTGANPGTVPAVLPAAAERDVIVARQAAMFSMMRPVDEGAATEVFAEGRRAQDALAHRVAYGYHEMFRVRISAALECLPAASPTFRHRVPNAAQTDPKQLSAVALARRRLLVGSMMLGVVAGHASQAHVESVVNREPGEYSLLEGWYEYCLKTVGKASVPPMPAPNVADDDDGAAAINKRSAFLAGMVSTLGEICALDFGGFPGERGDSRRGLQLGCTSEQLRADLTISQGKAFDPAAFDAGVAEALDMAHYTSVGVSRDAPPTPTGGGGGGGGGGRPVAGWETGPLPTASPAAAADDDADDAATNGGRYAQFPPVFGCPERKSTAQLGRVLGLRVGIACLVRHWSLCSKSDVDRAANCAAAFGGGWSHAIATALAQLREHRPTNVLVITEDPLVTGKSDRNAPINAFAVEQFKEVPSLIPGTSRKGVETAAQVCIVKGRGSVYVGDSELPVLSHNSAKLGSPVHWIAGIVDLRVVLTPMCRVDSDSYRHADPAQHAVRPDRDRRRKWLEGLGLSPYSDVCAPCADKNAFDAEGGLPASFPIRVLGTLLFNHARIYGGVLRFRYAVQLTAHMFPRLSEANAELLVKSLNGIAYHSVRPEIAPQWCVYPPKPMMSNTVPQRPIAHAKTNPTTAAIAATSLLVPQPRVGLAAGPSDGSTVPGDGGAPGADSDSVSNFGGPTVSGSVFLPLAENPLMVFGSEGDPPLPGTSPIPHRAYQKKVEHLKLIAGAEPRGAPPPAPGGFIITSVNTVERTEMAKFHHVYTHGQQVHHGVPHAVHWTSSAVFRGAYVVEVTSLFERVLKDKPGKAPERENSLMLTHWPAHWSVQRARVAHAALLNVVQCVLGPTFLERHALTVESTAVDPRKNVLGIIGREASPIFDFAAALLMQPDLAVTDAFPTKLPNRSIDSSIVTARIAIAVSHLLQSTTRTERWAVLHGTRVLESTMAPEATAVFAAAVHGQRVASYLRSFWIPPAAAAAAGKNARLGWNDGQGFVHTMLHWPPHGLGFATCGDAVGEVDACQEDPTRGAWHHVIVVQAAATTLFLLLNQAEFGEATARLEADGQEWAAHFLPFLHELELHMSPVVLADPSIDATTAAGAQALADKHTAAQVSHWLTDRVSHGYDRAAMTAAVWKDTGDASTRFDKSQEKAQHRNRLRADIAHTEAAMVALMPGVTTAARGGTFDTVAGASTCPQHQGSTSIAAAASSVVSDGDGGGAHARSPFDMRHPSGAAFPSMPFRSGALRKRAPDGSRYVVAVTHASSHHGADAAGMPFPAAVSDGDAPDTRVFVSALQKPPKDSGGATSAPDPQLLLSVALATAKDVSCRGAR